MVVARSLVVVVVLVTASACKDGPPINWYPGDCATVSAGLAKIPDAPADTVEAMNLRCKDKRLTQDMAACAHAESASTFKLCYDEAVKWLDFAEGR